MHFLLFIFQASFLSPVSVLPRGFQHFYRVGVDQGGPGQGWRSSGGQGPGLHELCHGMGARGVSSEHMENMEMFSCSPTWVRSDSQRA